MFSIGQIPARNAIFMAVTMAPWIGQVMDITVSLFIFIAIIALMTITTAAILLALLKVRLKISVPITYNTFRSRTLCNGHKYFAQRYLLGYFCFS